ncbi:MAG: MBL fold metallo-hydrolase [Deltaproteobacteria bacterium]|nr:MAG: MBL fold metallo-hydrolase [Deltaproteobacteria bacterium]
MRLRFLGGAETVTGSRFLVQAGRRRVLVDCGLFQGFKHLRERNWLPFPLPPRLLDAVVLTHAHLDHSGYVPVLVRDGLKARVHTTAATRDLCRLLLPDSGKLQEEEAAYANRKGYSKHKPARPLYTEAQARRALRAFRGHPFDRRIEVARDIFVTFRVAGHILGAAIVELEVDGHRIVFSGDLGRPHDPIMPAPANIERADVLLLESTYGNRKHLSEARDLGRLARAIRETEAKGGTVVIPAFAVGRAQGLLYRLHRLTAEGRIPRLPVYLDSPMATSATELYLKYPALHRLSPAECEVVFGQVEFVRAAEDSKALSADRRPKIIVSASGMATGGRVLHHIRAFGPDPNSAIVFAGYQAAGTRGAKMVAGATSVKIHGAFVPIRARVLRLDSFSAHADADEILEWVGRFGHRPRRTFIVHGEPEAADALRHRLEAEAGLERVQVAVWRDVVPLGRQ